MKEEEREYNPPHIDLDYCGCGVYSYRGLSANAASPDGQVMMIDMDGVYVNFEIGCKRGGEAYQCLEDVVNEDLPDRCDTNSPLDLLIGAVSTDLYTLTLKETLEDILPDEKDTE
tara:strand:- start:591 stop:935 length:345 start_codon:yes stop_codon:yes gene_type:complete